MSPLLPPISQQMALPSLASPTRSLAHLLRAATTPAPVSRRETGRQDWAQLRPPSFGERPPHKNTYGGRPFQSPPKNTYGGLAPFPIPHTQSPFPILGKPWSHSPSQHWGSRGAIAHPQPRGSSGAIAHPQPRGRSGAIAHPQT